VVSGPLGRIQGLHTAARITLRRALLLLAVSFGPCLRRGCSRRTAAHPPFGQPARHDMRCPKGDAEQSQVKEDRAHGVGDAVQQAHGEGTAHESEEDRKAAPPPASGRLEGGHGSRGASLFLRHGRGPFPLATACDSGAGYESSEPGSAGSARCAEAPAEAGAQMPTPMPPRLRAVAGLRQHAASRRNRQTATT